MKAILKQWQCRLLMTTTLSLSLFLCASNTLAQTFGVSQGSDEHIVWQRAPIEINLPIGRERFVSFPMAVQFGYNTQLLPESLLRVENDHQTLY
jgi:hypothetical protein